MTPQEILVLPMYPNDVGAETIREYLIELLATVWWEEEGFSGKRPFGNSGWQTDLYFPLAKAGLLSCTVVEEDGYPEFDPPLTNEDRKKGRKIIYEVIKEFC